MAKENRNAFYIVLSSATKQSKLKRHLQQKHPEHVEKDKDIFQRQKLLLKRQKLDASRYFQDQSTTSLTASFEVVLHIARQKNPHTIGKILVKTMCGRYVKVAFRRNKCKKKINKSLYPTT